MDMLKPMILDLFGSFGVCSFPLTDCSSLTAMNVMHQEGARIFDISFACKWTAPELDPLRHSTINSHIVRLCHFPTDSIVAKYIDQQQWSTLAQDIFVGFDEVKAFFSVIL
jgi:hypothetical protein